MKTQTQTQSTPISTKQEMPKKSIEAEWKDVLPFFLPSLTALSFIIGHLYFDVPHVILYVIFTFIPLMDYICPPDTLNLNEL